MAKIYNGLSGEADTPDHTDENVFLKDVEDQSDLRMQHRQIAGSYFDLTFKPTATVTYKSVFPQILACISAASFHLPVGLVAAYSAILIPQLQLETSDIKITDEDGTWIASITVLVVPIAASLAGILIDSIGRINTLKSAAVPYVIGWAVIATAPSLPYLMVGRFLTGFSLAMGTSPATAYITEVARPDLRGTLICLGPTMTSFGMVTIYLAGWVLHWRTVAWMSIGGVIIPLSLMYLFSPESPSWLVSRGRSSDALKSLKRISQDRTRIKKKIGDLVRDDKNTCQIQDDNSLTQKVQDEQTHLQQLRELEREHEMKAYSQEGMFKRFTKMMFKPSVYKPFFILTICFFIQQFSGIYILVFYTLNFIQDVGAKDVNQNAVSVIVGLIRMFVGFITSQLLYKIGRRTLCLTSLFFMAVFMMISGYFTYLIKHDNYETSWIRWIPIGLILMYICVSTMGLLSIPWTLTAEMYPLEVRGMMQGLTVAVAHILMFAAIKLYHWLMILFGGSFGLQWFFGCICTIGFVYIYVFLPETRKKTLNEIENYFNSNMIYIRRQSLLNRPKIPEKNANGSVCEKI